VPFTLAHAAAALPFRRTRLVPSALVAGCFAPDFEYFLRLAPGGGFGHTWLGMFALDLPLTLVVLWLFHTYMKEPFLILLPIGFKQRLKVGTNIFRHWRPAQQALIAISILVGAATHILWDSFTHPTFWPYRHWNLMSRTLSLPIVGEIQFYKLFQHGSTLIGVTLLLLWLADWYRATIPARRPEHAPRLLKQTRSAAIVVVITALIGATIRAVVGVGIPSSTHSLASFLGLAVITAITLFSLQWLVYGVALTMSSTPLNPRP
jgi:Domain of unknown function (DUF4184)